MHRKESGLNLRRVPEVRKVSTEAGLFSSLGSRCLWGWTYALELFPGFSDSRVDKARGPSCGAGAGVAICIYPVIVTVRPPSLPEKTPAGGH